MLYADIWWGVAGALWIGTGLVRAFAGLEKGSAYYLGNHLFLTKMALLIVLIAMEVVAVVGLTRWRSQVRRGQPPDTRLAGRYARISYVQAALVVLMVLAATAMARGYGMMPSR